MDAQTREAKHRQLENVVADLVADGLDSDEPLVVTGLLVLISYESMDPDGNDGPWYTRLTSKFLPVWQQLGMMEMERLAIGSLLIEQE